MSDSSQSLYASSLLGIALAIFKQLANEKIKECNDLYAKNEKKATELLISLKLEAYKTYIENIKKKFTYNATDKASAQITLAVQNIVKDICAHTPPKPNNILEIREMKDPELVFGKSPIKLGTEGIIADLKKNKGMKDVSNKIIRLI